MRHAGTPKSAEGKIFPDVRPPHIPRRLPAFSLQNDLSGNHCLDRTTEEPLMKQTYTPPVLESLSLRATQDIEVDLEIIIGIGS